MRISTILPNPSEVAPTVIYGEKEEEEEHQLLFSSVLLPPFLDEKGKKVFSLGIGKRENNFVMHHYAHFPAFFASYAILRSFHKKREA